MQVDSIDSDKALIISVNGRLDTTTASDFEKNCLESLSSTQNRSVLINLQDVEYMSSAGLRSILSLGKKVKSEGRSLFFCNLRGMVQEVFEVSGFTSIFPIYDSQEQALEAMYKS